MQNLRISHVNTFPYGGAATAAMRTHDRLINRGVDSQFFYSRDDRKNAWPESVHKIDVQPIKPGFFSGLFQKRANRSKQKEVYRLFNSHLKDRAASAETFSMAQLPESGLLPSNVTSADVIHLHWISFLADYPSFFKSIPKSLPIVWTLHDMNPFTGGCHYSSGCAKFTSGCGTCPQVISPGPNDVSSVSLAAKKTALAGHNIHVTAPSQWMLDLAKQSPVWPKDTTFQKIHLGFDLEKFFPVDRAAARDALGIESDAVLIGFGADDLSSQRKGFHHLLSALKQLKTDSIVECIVFGNGEIPDDKDLPKFHSMGFVSSPDRQRLVYSAADMVVVPSREDNQPQVGLEAMACGVPVVAFDAGGIPEYVRSGETGSLVELGDEAALAEKISGLCDLRSLRLRLGEAALEMVRSEFELTAQTEVYHQLYESISGRHARRAAA